MVRPGVRAQYAQAIRSIIGPAWFREQIERRPNYLDAANVQYADVLQVGKVVNASSGMERKLEMRVNM